MPPGAVAQAGTTSTSLDIAALPAARSPKIYVTPYAQHECYTTQAADTAVAPAVQQERYHPEAVVRLTDRALSDVLPLESSKMIKVIIRVRVAQVAVAGVIGAVVGLVTFTVAQITGRNLYIIIGALAGALAVFMLQQYLRTAQLAEIKINVPQISELTFVVNNDARQVAWKLYVEVITRISTQPLADDEGRIREALTSMYGLFATTRETLKASRPSVPVSGAQTVELLAVTMLNQELRPFLSKWHPRLSEFERAHPNGRESAWRHNEECRNELRSIQARLVEFALNFARLAGVRDAEKTVRIGKG